MLFVVNVETGHTCVDGIAAHQKTDVDFGQMDWAAISV